MIYQNEYVGFGLAGSYDCSFAQWGRDEDEVTMSVVSGAEYVSFHSATGDSLGDSVTGLANDLETMILVADGVEASAVRGPCGD